MAATRRIITLTGAGGIGKTTLGLLAARRLAATAGRIPVFVSLGALTDGTHLPALVEAALGQLGGPPTGDHLILFDSCEPVIEEVALLAERLVAATPGLLVLATSREPLRAQGEWILPLDGLAPDAAAQLFLRQAGIVSCPPATAALVTGLCRRLDGIPLAIELVAPLVATLGLPELARQLAAGLGPTLAGGPPPRRADPMRRALARHRTMGATLDWSLRLLRPAERALLTRLAGFPGRFSLEQALASPGDLPALLRLVDHSLVLADREGGAAGYRLAQLTRDHLLAGTPSPQQTAA